VGSVISARSSSDRASEPQSDGSRCMGFTLSDFLHLGPCGGGGQMRSKQGDEDRKPFFHVLLASEGTSAVIELSILKKQ